MTNTLRREFLKLKVWEKGHEIPFHDRTVFRKDDYNNIIEYSKYGDRNAKYGWEIDHIKPSALGGSDGEENLRPLHWRQNTELGNTLQKLLTASPRNNLLNSLK